MTSSLCEPKSSKALHVLLFLLEVVNLLGSPPDWLPNLAGEAPQILRVMVQMKHTQSE